MTNTVDNQPAAVSLQLTDELLLYQGAQSPPTRKLPVSGLGTYYLSLATGGTISGNVTVSSSTFNINGASASNRSAFFQTSGVNRWELVTDSTPETGSNTGSGFALIALSDGGSPLFNVMAASRATGQVTFAQPTNFTVGGNSISYTSTNAITATQTGAVAATGLIVDESVTSGNLCLWRVNGGSVGSITSNGSTTAYNTTSDARLKIDDGLMSFDDAASIVRKLRPRWFRWTSEPSADKEPGFFAQQVHRVFPWAVTKGRKVNGNLIPWGMDSAKLMPAVVAYIQGLEKRIADLERACR